MFHPSLLDIPQGVTGKRKQPGKAQLWWQKICGMNVLGEKLMVIAIAARLSNIIIRKHLAIFSKSRHFFKK